MKIRFRLKGNIIMVGGIPSQSDPFIADEIARFAQEINACFACAHYIVSKTLLRGGATL